MGARRGPSGQLANLTRGKIYSQVVLPGSERAAGAPHRGSLLLQSARVHSLTHLGGLPAPPKWPPPMLRRRRAWPAQRQRPVVLVAYERHGRVSGTMAGVSGTMAGVSGTMAGVSGTMTGVSGTMAGFPVPWPGFRCAEKPLARAPPLQVAHFVHLLALVLPCAFLLYVGASAGDRRPYLPPAVPACRGFSCSRSTHCHCCCGPVGTARASPRASPRTSPRAGSPAS